MSWDADKRLDTALAEIAVLRSLLRAMIAREDTVGGSLLDWACAECRPNSHVLVKDFQCAYHAAKARVGDRVMLKAGDTFTAASGTGLPPSGVLR